MIFPLCDDSPGAIGRLTAEWMGDAAPIQKAVTVVEIALTSDTGRTEFPFLVFVPQACLALGWCLHFKWAGER